MKSNAAKFRLPVQEDDLVPEASILNFHYAYPEAVNWNQGERKLFMAEISTDPRAPESWPLTEILDTSKVTTAIKQEGMAAFDVDGDGRVDLLAGLYWFKHEGGNNFTPIQIADHPGRIAAGYFFGFMGHRGSMPLGFEL